MEQKGKETFGPGPMAQLVTMPMAAGYVTPMGITGTTEVVPYY